ncbi:Hypothetical protein ACI5QM_02157 [Bacillus subtilis]
MLVHAVRSKIKLAMIEKMRSFNLVAPSHSTSGKCIMF